MPSSSTAFFRGASVWLRRVMPAIYLCIGLAAVALERNALGRLSGALLIVAVFVAVARRRRHRARAEALNSRHSSTFAVPSRLASTTELVRALVPPKLGHADIDRQHRSLASKSATLRVAFAHADDAADIELLVHELIDALTLHLRAEADAMARLGVARADEDVRADDARIAEAERDLERCRYGEITLEALVERVAGAMVAGHLKGAHPLLPSMESALRELRAASGSATP